MRQSLFILILTAMTTHSTLFAQQIDFSKVKAFEHQLDGVMEIIDTTQLKLKLKEVEGSYALNQNEINKARLGIIYHEIALNLSFFSNSQYKGYAKKSYEILKAMDNPTTSHELLPFISSYKASALSLISAETKKIKFLGKAFEEFSKAVEKYGDVSYVPEFLRGSVSENMPWIFFSKRKYAKPDLQSIIDKNKKNPNFGNWKVMSFTYWAWAKQHQSKRYRTQALSYLESAIALDPNYLAGRKRSEDLKAKLLQK